jgi:hypothetical protein
MSTDINTAEQTIDSAFESLITLLTRPDKQDWFQVVNAYVVDTYEMPNIIHFKQHADDEQKKSFCKSVIEAIKLGNKSLLVPEPVKGDVKPDEEEVAKSKAKAKPKAEPAKDKAEEPEPATPPQPSAIPATGGLEAMLVAAVMQQIGQVSVPDHVIKSKVEAAVKSELDDRWSAITDMVNKKLDAMQQQVDEFTRTTPPRDVFHVTISAQSEKELAAVKQITDTNALGDL